MIYIFLSEKSNAQTNSLCLANNDCKCIKNVFTLAKLLQQIQNLRVDANIKHNDKAEVITSNELSIKSEYSYIRLKPQ